MTKYLLTNTHTADAWIVILLGKIIKLLEQALEKCVIQT